MLGAKYVWGIEIGGFAVKGVKLLAAGDDFEVVDFEILPHTGEPQPVDGPIADRRAWRTLALFQERHKIRSEHVVVSVPGHCIFTRPIGLIAVSGKQLHDLVRYEAQQQVGIDLDAVLWDYEIFPPEDEDDPSRQGLLFAMKKADYNSFIRSLDAARIQVDDVQTIPLAVYNFVQHTIAPSGPLLAIDIGANTVDLVAIYQERYWARTIPTGGDQMTKALQEEFSCDHASAETIKVNAPRSSHAREVLQRMLPSMRAMVSEIRNGINLLRSDVRGVKFGQAVALGGAAKTLGLSRLLSEELGCSVISPLGLEHIPLGEEVNSRTFVSEAGSLAGAIGLALQGAGHAATDVSLVSAGTVRGKRLTRTRPFAMASLAVVAALLALYLVFAHRERDAYVEANRRLAQRLDIIRGRYDAWNKIKRRFAQEERVLASYKRLGEHRGVFLRVLKAVEQIIGPGVKRRMWLRSLEMKMPRSSKPEERYTTAEFVQTSIKGATERKYKEKERDTRRSVNSLITNHLRGLKEIPEPTPTVTTNASAELDQLSPVRDETWKYLFFSVQFNYYFVPKDAKKK